MSYVIFNYVNEDSNEDRLLDVGMIVFSIIYLFAFFINVHNMFPKNYSFKLDSKDVNYIKSVKPKRLFNAYNNGGDLVYNDIKVFIDGRADLYSSSDVFKDFIDIYYFEGDYYSLMCKYSFDYYLVEKNSSLDYYLRYNDQFKLIYMNGDVKMYEKKN